MIKLPKKEANIPNKEILPDKPGVLRFKVKMFIGSFFDNIPISEAKLSEIASAIKVAYTTKSKELWVIW